MYPDMAHSTSRQELDDVKDFLLTIIPEEEAAPVTRYLATFAVGALAPYFMTGYKSTVQDTGLTVKLVCAASR